MALETYRGFVYPWAIDHVGHMNVQFYVARFDEASWHFLGALGLPPSKLRSEGMSFVAIEQVTGYRKEVLAGSLLHVHTQLLEIGNKTLKYRHTMFDSETDEEVASMQLLIACFDTRLRRAVPVPDAARARAQSMLP